MVSSISSKPPLDAQFSSPIFLEKFLAKRSWEPGWLADFRKDSWEKLIAIPESKLKDEMWRFSPKSRLGFSNCMNLSDLSVQPILKSPSDVNLYFNNFDQTILKSPERFNNLHQFKNPGLGSDQTFLLGCCYAESGFKLHVDKGLHLKEPLLCNHQAPSNNESLFQICSISLEPFTELTLIEFFESEDEKSSGILSNLCNIELSEGSRLNRIIIQKVNLSSTFNHLENVHLEKNSEFTNISIQLGGAQSRIESKGIISGEGSSFNNFSISLGQNEQLFDQRTVQHHIHPNSKSNLLFKNALLGNSKSIFSGLIKVDQKAKNTDAYQTNRNLLLSEHAEADSLPGLEILANEVKCSHGATTSKIDKQELFYLQSRGIPTKIAEKLIVMGFFDEVVREANTDDSVELLRNQISNFF